MNTTTPQSGAVPQRGTAHVWQLIGVGLIAMGAGAIAWAGWTHGSRESWAPGHAPLMPRESVVPTPSPILEPSADGRRRWSSYEEMHDFFVASFVSSEGFGDSRTPRPLARQNELDISGKLYHIGHVELISLGDGAGLSSKGSARPPARGEPFAYATMNDPTRRMLKDAKYRELSKPEMEALVTLKAGGESTIIGSTEHPVLVGALRATESCLECHNGKEHDLLGAFSYSLVLTPTSESPTFAAPVILGK